VGASRAVGGAALNNLHLVNTYDEFTQYIESHRKNITTGLWLGDADTPPTIGWVANLFVTSSLTAQQFLDILLANTTIATTWSPFDIPFNPGIGDALNLAIYMGIAFACYPAFFGLYPSTERRRFVRALQYSNGVRPFPLWAAYLIFDFSLVLVTSAIVTGLWSGLSDIWYHLEYIFVVFFLYGLALLYGYAGTVSLAGIATAFNVESSTESGRRYDRIGKTPEGRMSTESYDNASKHGRYGVLVAERFMVQAEGDAVPMSSLKAAVSGLDLAPLQVLAKPRPAPGKPAPPAG